MLLRGQKNQLDVLADNRFNATTAASVIKDYNLKDLSI